MSRPRPFEQPVRRPVLRFPGRVDLDLVVRSHGWYDLPPFAYDDAKRELTYSAEDGGRPYRVTVREKADGLTVSSSRGVPVAVVRASVRRVLDLGADLHAFHARCDETQARADGFGWIAKRGGGRILRAPTLFEDAVKVLATTNCSWALTRLIVRDLIALHGNGGTFPTPASVAAHPESRLKKEAHLGYRAPYLAAFADRVASGKLDLSRWEEPARPAAEVEREILQENGFGPYAAASLGRLLGRHAKLGLDSWSRKRAAELRFRGRKIADARIEKFYFRFGDWAGLAFWLDVTREWHEGKERLWP